MTNARNRLAAFCRRHLTLGLLLLAGGASAICFQLASTPSMTLNFDVGVHFHRSIRAYWLLHNWNQSPGLAHWLLWSGMLGDRSGFPELEGNHYGPAWYLFAGACFHVFGPSVRTGILLLAPVMMLLMLSAWGFARECWEDDRLACLCAAVVMASPCVMLHTHLFFLDLPLAAVAGVSFWMLMASRDFTRRLPSLVMGLAMGLGALIKPIFIVYVGVPVFLKAFIAALKSLRGVVSRLLLVVVVAACGLGLQQFMKWIALGSPDTHDMGIIERTLRSMGGATMAWLVVRVAIRILPARDAEARRTGANAVDGLGLSLVLASLWNFTCLPRLTAGLFPTNPGEPSGIASIPSGLWYYLVAVKNDVLMWPLFFLMLAGIVLAWVRPAWRGHAFVAIAAMLGVVLLSIHGGRLSRYLLPWMVPLAFLTVAPVALLGERPRRLVVLALLTWCVYFNWSWSFGEESRVRYVEWGNRTVPSEGWDRILPYANPPSAYWMADLPRQGGEWVDGYVGRALDVITRATRGQKTWIAVAPSPEFRRTQNVNFHYARFVVEGEIRGLPLRFSPREDLVSDEGTFPPGVEISNIEVDAVLAFLCIPPPAHLGSWKLEGSYQMDRSTWFALYLRPPGSAPATVRSGELEEVGMASGRP